MLLEAHAAKAPLQSMLSIRNITFVSPHTFNLIQIPYRRPLVVTYWRTPGTSASLFPKGQAQVKASGFEHTGGLLILSVDYAPFRNHVKSTFKLTPLALSLLTFCRLHR